MWAWAFSIYSRHVCNFIINIYYRYIARNVKLYTDNLIYHIEYDDMYNIKILMDQVIIQ